MRGAGSRTSRCSRAGRSSSATAKPTSASPPPPCGAAWPRRRGEGRDWSGASGPFSAIDGVRRQERRAGACWPRSKTPPTRCRSSPAARPSFIPDARRRCNSDPRSSPAGSANAPRAPARRARNGPIVAFEITLDAIPAPKARPTKAKAKLERSEFMPLRARPRLRGRRGGRAPGEILKAALGADRALIANADVFDVYRGPGLPEGHESVAITVTLQPRERTLTDAEIEAVGRGKSSPRSPRRPARVCGCEVSNHASGVHSSARRRRVFASARRRARRTIRLARNTKSRSPITPASPGSARTRRARKRSRDGDEVRRAQRERPQKSSRRLRNLARTATQARAPSSTSAGSGGGRRRDAKSQRACAGNGAIVIAAPSVAKRKQSTARRPSGWLRPWLPRYDARGDTSDSAGPPYPPPRGPARFAGRVGTLSG